jgi:hypothetical protein
MQGPYKPCVRKADLCGASGKTERQLLLFTHKKKTLDAGMYEKEKVYCPGRSGLVWRMKGVKECCGQSYRIRRTV